MPYAPSHSPRNTTWNNPELSETVAAAGTEMARRDARAFLLAEHNDSWSPAWNQGRRAGTESTYDFILA